VRELFGYAREGEEGSAPSLHANNACGTP
jgi:hypothetical protein